MTAVMSTNPDFKRPLDITTLQGRHWATYGANPRLHRCRRTAQLAERRNMQSTLSARAPVNVPTWIFLAVPCALATTLSLLLLNSKSFWLDEAESLRIADAHRHLLAVAFTDGGNFALYYVLLHEWLRLGTSDGFVRLLSVISAVLSVAALFALGRHLGGRLLGAIAAGMLAINPFFIAYAQEARGYSLLLLLSILSTYFLVRAIEEPGLPWRWAAYVATAVLMVYTHLFGLFVLAAHAATLPFLPQRVPWRFGLASAASILGLLLPLARVASRHGTESIAWIPPVSIPLAVQMLSSVAGGPALAVLFVVLVAYALVSSLGPNARSASPAPFLPLLLMWLVVPIALAALFSALGVRIFFPRYLIVVLAPIVLLAAVGVVRIPRRWVASALVAIVAVLSAQGLWLYYFFSPKEDWRGAAAFIASGATRGDALVCVPAWENVPLQHAASEVVEPHGFPALIPVADIGQTGMAAFDPGVHGALAQGLARHARIWVVQGDFGLTSGFRAPLLAQRKAIVHALSNSRAQLVDRSFQGVSVQLFSKEAPRHG